MRRGTHARSSSSPLGPWVKSDKNPVLAGNATADPKHCFINDTRCSGIYLASVMHGPQTGHKFWVYMEAPINSNDEGPMALWEAAEPEGPYAFLGSSVRFTPAAASDDGALDPYLAWIDTVEFSQKLVVIRKREAVT